MKSITTSKIAALLISLLTFSVVFVIAATYGLSRAEANSNAQGSTIDIPAGENGNPVVIPTGEYPVNDFGLTYGPAIQSMSLDGRWPDLVLAMATNGREGYIYLSDMRGSELTSLEEAGQLTKEKITRESIRFTSLLFERLGLPAELDVSTALLAYETAKRYAYSSSDREWSPDQGLRNTLIKIIGAGSAALPDGEELRMLLIGLLAETYTSGLVEIPVYASDGITQIGVFNAPS